MSKLVSTFVLLICFYVAFAQETYETCNDPNNARGDCRPIKLCDFALKILSNRPISNENRDYLRSAQCGTTGRDPWVCCKLQQSETAVEHSEIEDRLNLGRKVGLPRPPVCGIDVQDRIWGGEDCKIDEFPWLAQIGYEKYDGSVGFHCGGTLITDRFVLTAAHCVSKVPKSWKLSKVRLGEWDTLTDVDCDDSFVGEPHCAPPHKDFKVILKIVHDGYEPNTKNQHNDIALLKLLTKVKFTDYIKPICMPLEKSLRNSALNSIAMDVAGWGKTETASTSTKKLKVSVDTFLNDDCKKIYGRQKVEIIDGQICAGGETGKDSCNGDSGGPLMTENSKGNPPYWFQVGIVSYGPKNCGTPNIPGVYTRVSKYIDWIEQKIQF